jgi:PAS domain S-box-containing protein
MKWSIEKEIAVGLALAGLILLFAGVLSYRSGHGFIESSEWVSHTHQVLAELEATLSAVAEAETATLGYVITGQENFFQSYQAAAPQIRSHLDRLKALTSDNARQQLRIGDLKGAIAQKIDSLRVESDLRRYEGFQTARERVGTGTGTRQMGQVRAVISAMKQEESDLLERRNLDFKLSSRRTTLTFSFVIFLDFVLLGFGYYVVRRDLRERKRAQDELRRTEERFDLSVRGSNDGIWDWNIATNEVYFSPRWKRMLGYQEHEIGDHLNSWAKRVHPKDYDLAIAAMRAHLNGLSPFYELEHRLLHKDHSYRWVLARGVCVRDGRGKAYRMAGSQTDITERKRAIEHILLLNAELAAANRQLEMRNREVERANQLKSQFLASMSHELRTPLNAIIGFSDLLGEGKPGTLTDKQRKFVARVRQSAHHLLALINDILDLSKIESGLLELNRETFSTSAAMPEVLSIIRPLAMAKKIQIEDSGESYSVSADRIRFKQILYNLLSNALKFTPEGGKVAITCSSSANLVCISVTDTGVGIRREDQQIIFEEFRQLGETTRGVKEGTGLGLAITKRLVEQQGGTIEVASEVGSGSCFSFTLPVGQDIREVRPPMGQAIAEART